MNSTTNTSNCLVLSTESSDDLYVPVSDAPAARRAKHNSKKIENAIYAYIKAIRALGRNTVNTTQIADGLSLSVYEVNRAISSLKRKGVKAMGV